MKNKYSLLFLPVFLFFTNFSSQSVASNLTPSQKSGPFGLGAVLGSPTAITGKTYLSSRTALDFGFSFFASEYFLLYGDYLLHYPGILRAPGLERAVGYMGAGAVLAFTNTTRSGNSGLLGTSQGSVGLGVRVPFGILWEMQSAPAEFFGEIVPGISVVPSTTMILEIGIGARYFFH